jgi:hypothetical protein
MFLVEGLAFLVVIAAGLFLLALGVASLVVPVQAGSFLLGFAGSKFLHFFEVSLRFIAGAAFVLHAPRMSFSSAFAVFGWVLLITTAFLCLIPWHLHRRFAQTTVPYATQYIALLGLASLAIGGFVFVGLVRGVAG